MTTTETHSTTINPCKVLITTPLEGWEWESDGGEYLRDEGVMGR